MPVAVAIRHLAFEDLGSFAPLLTSRGYDIRYFDAGVDDLSAAASADVLIVLGGPIGVNDGDLYPFLRTELQLIEKRLAADKPIFGICLGVQLMAHALGAKIYASPVKEIGWKKIKLTAEGKKSCLQHLGETEPVLHWHGDTFDLPKDTLLLASTAEVPHQAFCKGSNILGLQFHSEAVGERIEQWLIGHTCELTHNGIDIVQIRKGAQQWGNSLTRRNAAMFGQWLDGLQFNQVSSLSSSAA